jgi:succinate dehydrogenase / fumarate reductase flavoprotein subunit
LVSENLMTDKVGDDHPEFDKCLKESKDRFSRLLNVKGTRSVDSFHRDLGNIMWERVGMSRNKERLEKAISEISDLRKEFWKDVKVTGTDVGLNVELEKANRVADFLELGELMARDALERNESCGGHFREESQTEENEALRDDDNYAHVAAWEFSGDEQTPIRNIEELSFDNVPLTQRSYK